MPKFLGILIDGWGILISLELVLFFLIQFLQRHFQLALGTNTNANAKDKRPCKKVKSKDSVLKFWRYCPARQILIVQSTHPAF